MQAGLTNRALTLREIFSSRLFLVWSNNAPFILFYPARPVTPGARGVALAAWRQLMTEGPLKFGREFRTPAWQAGLTNRALTLREIFSARIVFLALKNLLFKTLWAVSFRIPAVPLAA
jgi:hypothetical protein